MVTHYLGEDRSLEVAGDVEERAALHGRACAGQYAAAASSIGSLLVDPRFTGHGLHVRGSQLGLGLAGAYYLARHARVLRSWQDGALWRAQRGLARGAGLPLPLMFGLGAVPELVGAQIGFTVGCSAFALATGSAAGDAPLIAYNHDFPPRFGRYSFVRRNLPTDGLASVVLTYPIMVGCLAGVNERGLALTLNHAFARDFQGRAGVLLTSLVQHALDRCEDVDQAVELVLGTPVTNGAIITLADRSGARAAVEVSCTRARVRRPEGRALVASFNRYQHPDMAEVEIPLGARATGLIAGMDLHASNVSRAARLEALRDHLGEEPDAAMVRALMADHDGGGGDPGTICRHRDPLSETLWSALLDPAAGALTVGFGHACTAQPRTYRVGSPAERVRIADVTASR